MAEAVAALSLAANILQVLDLGRQFAVAAWSTYESGSDSIKIFSDLKSTSNDLGAALQELKEGATRAPATGSLNGDGEILKLAQECSNALDRTQKSLASFGWSEKGRKRDAAVIAFKSIWKKKDIEDLQKRLENFRDQLTFHVVVSLKYVI